MIIPRAILHQSYVVLLAHPGDEIHIAGFLYECVRASALVRVVYLTSGDRGGESKQREIEAYESLRIMGIPHAGVVFARIPEQELLTKLRPAVTAVLHHLHGTHVDCIIAPEYEGGHEGHDATAFVAAQIMRRCAVVHHMSFPLYHGHPSERRAGVFLPEREGDPNCISLELDREHQSLKHAVILAHRSQRVHFDSLWKTHDGNHDAVMSREWFRLASDDTDFLMRPTAIVGYEAHRNGWTHAQFVNAIQEYYTSVVPPRRRVTTSTLRVKHAQHMFSQ